MLALVWQDVGMLSASQVGPPERQRETGRWRGCGDRKKSEGSDVHHECFCHLSVLCSCAPASVIMAIAADNA